MNDPNTNEANGVATGQPAGSALVRRSGEAVAEVDNETAVAHAEFERSRNPDAELHLQSEDDNGLHLRDHSLHIGGDSLPLLGTDGKHPIGTILKG